MQRPDDFPDFSNPPLDEVVLGVQFAPVPNYSSVGSREVWGLFKDAFPIVEEHPLLNPQFETFGGANPPHDLSFFLGQPPVGTRLWFVSQDLNHLIQFQPDRFITNWRKTGNLQPYPRFEAISDSFEKNLLLLSEHFRAVFNYQLQINQAEVTYINLIPASEFAEAGKWFGVCNSASVDVESIRTNFAQVATDGDGKPYARLITDIQSVFLLPARKKLFKMSLVFKGKPAASDIPSAMEFIRGGRERIVKQFRDITTAEAHESWGRRA